MSTTAIDFFAPLKTLWDGAAALSSIAGPFLDRAPFGTEFPYCVIRSVSNARTMRSSHSQIWDSAFDVILYHRTIELVSPLVAAVGDVLDEATLTLASGKGAVFLLERANETYLEQDKNVYMGVVSYELKRQKSR